MKTTFLRALGIVLATLCLAVAPVHAAAKIDDSHEYAYQGTEEERPLGQEAKRIALKFIREIEAGDTKAAMKYIYEDDGKPVVAEFRIRAIIDGQQKAGGLVSGFASNIFVGDERVGQFPSPAKYVVVNHHFKQKDGTVRMIHVIVKMSGAQRGKLMHVT